MFKIDFLKIWNPIVVVIFCVIGCVPVLIGGLILLIVRPLKTGRLMKEIGFNKVVENLISSANMTGFIFFFTICYIICLMKDGIAFIGGRLLGNCLQWRYVKENAKA